MHRLHIGRVVLVGVILIGLAGAWVVVRQPAWTRNLLHARAPRNLLLISLDTVRADHIGSYGHRAARTPRLDALAAAGLRFEKATTVAPLTLPAHSSLMTGTFPGWHGVRDNGGFYLDEAQITLAEVLREKGLRTGGFVGAFVLDRRWGIAQGFDRYFDEFDLDSFRDSPAMDAIQRPGAEVVDEALEWLAENDEQPFFAWVHLYDPHAPYEPREPFRGQFPRTPRGAYDAEIAYADAQVGRVLDQLERDGRLADTLVVVVGDHGEMFGEHGEQTHGFFIYEGATRIPLIMAGPGVPSRVVREQVRLVDVMPTALGLLGAATGAPMQGVDMMPLARGESLGLVAYSESWSARYHYGWSELRALQDGRFKYIGAPRPELYDLERDPGERDNLAEQNSSRVDVFARALEEFDQRTIRADAPDGPRPIDAETEERLAALGYVSGSTSRRRLEERPRGDPKDKIALYTLLKQAGTSSLEGRYDDAIAQVKAALAEDPGIVEAYMLLGNFYKKAKRPQDAVAAYRQALALDDEHQAALFTLAVTYKEHGRLEDARAGFERARELDPRNGKVLWQLADVWIQLRNPVNAEAVIRDALARNVDEHRFLLKLGETQFQAGRFADAEHSIRMALEKKPDLETARFHLGVVYEEMGRIDAATEAYRSELDRHPKAYRAAFNLAKLLHNSGRTNEALGFYKKAVELQPAFGTGQLYLAKALLDAGDLRGAERWAREGLGNRPEPRLAPLGHYVLADVYNREGRTADAQRALDAARRLKQDPP
jgi:choline-sulfatase